MGERAPQRRWSAIPTWRYWWRSRFGGAGIGMIAAALWMWAGLPADWRVVFTLLPVALLWYVFSQRWAP